uniref:Wsv260-like protein n=1 Tax=Pasiphaea japonica whispovirus TaxID=2984286 RepID=A0A9C7F8N1_9VIRU|nr:MAG: wsv260-like protein [Pasiphaea japonica whispovirus]
MENNNGNTSPSVSFSDEPDTIHHYKSDNKPISDFENDKKSVKKNRQRTSSQNIIDYKPEQDNELIMKDKINEFKKEIDDFAKTLTPEVLAETVKMSTNENIENLGIKNVLSGVPNNGRASLSPTHYCNECVSRIESYIEKHDFSDAVIQHSCDNIEDEDKENKPLFINDKRRLANTFLDNLKLQFYDHITIQGFNENAMNRGGLMYGTPLSDASVIDCVDEDDEIREKIYGGNTETNMFDTLAGEEVVAAAQSTGICMSVVNTNHAKMSENSHMTHRQVLKENIEIDKIRKACSCFKSNEWYTNRERKCIEAQYNLKQKLLIESDVYQLNDIEKKEDEAKKKNLEKPLHDNDTDNRGCSVSNDEEDDGNQEKFAETEEVTEQTPTVYKNGDNDDGGSSISDISDCDSTTSAFTYTIENDNKATEDRTRWKNDWAFRPGSNIKEVETVDEFDNDYWSKLRTASCCLSICRHDEKCIANELNKKNILSAIRFVALSPGEYNENETIRSTCQPPNHYTVISNPDTTLMFSLGSSTYECLGSTNLIANYCHEDVSSSSSMCSISSLSSSSLPPNPYTSKVINAKVYTTIQTIAFPFCRASMPISNIDYADKYGYYKTSRIQLPSDFTGHYNDCSNMWRATLYNNMTENLCASEFNKGSKNASEMSAINYTTVLVKDDSGDLSGNYLKGYKKKNNKFHCNNHDNNYAAKNAALALQNIATNAKQLQVKTGELMMGPLKTQLVEYKTNTEKIKLLMAESTTSHQEGRMKGICDESLEKFKITANTISRCDMWLKQMVRDIRSTYKYMYLYIPNFKNCISINEEEFVSMFYTV